jgi:hypothetical protein
MTETGQDNGFVGIFTIKQTKKLKNKQKRILSMKLDHTDEIGKLKISLGK